MKDTKKINILKTSVVTYDPELDKYQGMVLFPEKLALAKEKLKNAKFPERKITERSSKAPK